MPRPRCWHRPARSGWSWIAIRPAIEPDFALVKFKKLAGGGYFKIINRAVPQALAALGYDSAEIAAIERYALGHGTLKGAPGINHESLREKGFDEAALADRRGGPRLRIRHQVYV